MYRVTKCREVTMPIHGPVIEVYGVYTGPFSASKLAGHGHEAWIGVSLDGVPFQRNDLVVTTIKEDDNGMIYVVSCNTAAEPRRLWSKTHGALLEQEIKQAVSRAEFYDMLTTVDDEGKDARDFYNHLRHVLIGMRRPPEGV